MEKSSIDSFELYERIKYFRNLRGFSQDELANRAKVSQSTIAQLESGKKDPSVTTLKKISAALDIEIAILFAGNNIHVFDMKRLESKYTKSSDLNPTLYKAIGEVIRYAKKINFI